MHELSQLLGLIITRRFLLIQLLLDAAGNQSDIYIVYISSKQSIPLVQRFWICAIFDWFWFLTKYDVVSDCLTSSVRCQEQWNPSRRAALQSVLVVFVMQEIRWGVKCLAAGHFTTVEGEQSLGRSLSQARTLQLVMDQTQREPITTRGPSTYRHITQGTQPQDDNNPSCN